MPRHKKLLSSFKTNKNKVLLQQFYPLYEVAVRKTMALNLNAYFLSYRKIPCLIHLIGWPIGAVYRSFILLMRYLVYSLLIICLLSSCWFIEKGDAFNGIAPGTWRGVFKLSRQSVPVLYEVKNSDNDLPLQLSFQTGATTVVSDTAYLFGDTLLASFALTQTQLKVVYQIDQMNGYLYDLTEQQYPIEFAGIKGPRHRFPDIREQPLVDLTGEWQVTANAAEDTSITATLRLSADNNKVTGTLTRENGMTYSLEGTVQGSQLYLSGFDGRQVLWVNAKIKDNQHLEAGSLRINGESFFWEAQRKAGVSGF